LQGQESIYWQALLVETQMLFHQHPVNRQRQQSGGLSINGLWVDGAGRLEGLQPQAAFQRVAADEPLARGLGHLAGMVLDDGSSALSNGDLRVFVGFHHAVLAADGHGWREAFTQFETMVDQVLVWMSDKRNRVVTLYPCNGDLYRMDGRKLRLFWRRQRPFHRYYGD
jgi:hypothetical protein